MPGPCPRCQQPIVYAHRLYPDDSASHAVLPIDYLASEAGAWVLAYREGWNWLLFEPFDEARHAGRRRYRGHFSTCPDSPLWKTKRKQKRKEKRRGKGEVRSEDEHS